MRVMGVDFVEPHSDVPPSPGRAQAWQDFDGSGDFELRYIDHRGELVRASLEPADGYSVAGEWLGRHRVLALVSPYRGEVAGGRYARNQGWRHVAVTRPGDGETIGLALLP